jgi:ABC-type iron transport system FetAB ATPase subunit
MPVVKILKSGEQEALTGPGGVGQGDLSRITTNITLADHIGKFIAGQVQTQFQNENLADVLKGKNMIMISGSWG